MNLREKRSIQNMSRADENYLRETLGDETTDALLSPGGTVGEALSLLEGDAAVLANKKVIDCWPKVVTEIQLYLSEMLAAQAVSANTEE